jgi:tRNA-specific 2-thiouridylase
VHGLPGVHVRACAGLPRRARRWGLRAFSAPAGGCLLTDPHFSKRLETLFAHTAGHETTEADLELLRLGRHFYPEPGLRIILGRNLEENRRLTGFEGPSRWIVEPDDFGGPTALVCGAETRENLAGAARLIARHSRSAASQRTVHWRWGGGHEVAPLGEILGPGREGAAT